MKEPKFVVKINDKTYNSWAYIKTEFKAPWGKYGYFFEKDCFDTEDEAKLFIKDMLKNPSELHHWRPEVDETWFEVVPVYYSTFFKQYVPYENLRLKLED